MCESMCALMTGTAAGRALHVRYLGACISCRDTHTDTPIVHLLLRRYKAIRTQMTLDCSRRAPLDKGFCSGGANMCRVAQWVSM